MKKLLTIFLFLSFISPVYSAELEEVNGLKNYAYRLCTSNTTEMKYSEIEAQKNAKLQADTIFKQKQEYIEKITYADTTLKKISNELYKELNQYNSDILSDLRQLWLGAATKSETIKFAIYKLSNPDENKPSTNPVKKIIKPLASITSMASLGIGDPLTSTTAMIGSNLLGAFSYDNKDLNYKYTKVTDADLIVLMSKIDDLQNQILVCYTNYMSARGAYEISFDVMQKRYKLCQNSTKLSDMESIINDAYYREAQNNFEKQKAEFETRRAELEQIVGTEALKELEKTIETRNQ